MLQNGFAVTSSSVLAVNHVRAALRRLYNTNTAATNANSMTKANTMESAITADLYLESRFNGVGTDCLVGMC